MSKNETHVIIGIHMSAPIIIQEAAVFGNKGSFKQTEKAGGEPMKRNNLVAVALISDITESEEDTTSLKFKAKGDFLHGLSAIPMKPRLQVGKTTNYEKSSDYLALRLVSFKCARRKATRGELHNKVDKNGGSPNARSSEQLGRCAEFIEATVEVARKKSRDAHVDIRRCLMCRRSLAPWCSGPEQIVNMAPKNDNDSGSGVSGGCNLTVGGPLPYSSRKNMYLSMCCKIENIIVVPGESV